MGRWKPFNTRRACLRKAPENHTLIGLCVMYCGTSYRGLQLQTHAPTHHTVEGVLIQALKDAGIVDGLHRGRVSGDAHRFARSCRTDRGVHAVRNLICLFVDNGRLESAGGCRCLPQKLNALLPSTIRVAQATQLMGDFVPRFCCDRRVYRYMIPAYALMSPCTSWEEFYTKFPGSNELLQHRALGSDFVDFCPGKEEAGTFLSLLGDVVSRGNDLLLRHIVGTHFFHNFSVSINERGGGGGGWNKKIILPDDNTAVRSVIRCEIATRLFLLKQGEVGPTIKEYEAFLETAESGSGMAAETRTLGKLHFDGAPLPFVVFQIEGRSFLFNMIRKIVGLTLAVLRGARETLFEEVLSREWQANCPLAPSPYLLLFQSFYGSYDRKARLRASDRFRPLEDEWSGEVVQKAGLFTFANIAADIVDLDLNRVPALGTMLSARDAQRRITRPSCVEEDSHLGEMKEFHPAVLEPHPVCSEMTLFLRSLRVHNWGLLSVKKPVKSNLSTSSATKNSCTSTAEKLGVKRQRSEDGEMDEIPAKMSHKEEEGDGRNEDADSTEFVRGAPASKEVDDGWLYVASTPEEECRLRSDYQRRVQMLQSNKRVSSARFACETLLQSGDGGGSE